MAIRLFARLWSTCLIVFAVTTTSAQTWVPLTSGTTESLYSVFFTSPTVGYAGGTTNTILKTTDGGSSWTKLNLTSLGHDYETAQYLSLYFPTANEGYAVGTISGAGVILKTTDAGASWTPQTLPASVLPSNFFYGGPTRQFVCATTSQIAGASGGSTWTTLYSNPGHQLQGIAFVDSLTGVAVGYGGAAIRTTNGGTTWSDITMTTAGAWRDLEYAGGRTLYAVGWKSGAGSIIKSIDGGATWSDQVSGSSVDLYGVSFADTANGFAVGGSTATGTIMLLRTTNGGTTWTNGSTSSTNQFLFAVHAVTPGLAYAVGQGGVIFKTGSSTGITPRAARSTRFKTLRTWTDARGRMLPAMKAESSPNAILVPTSGP